MSKHLTVKKATSVLDTEETKIKKIDESCISEWRKHRRLGTDLQVEAQADIADRQSFAIVTTDGSEFMIASKNTSAEAEYFVSCWKKATPSHATPSHATKKYFVEGWTSISVFKEVEASSKAEAKRKFLDLQAPSLCWSCDGAGKDSNGEYTLNGFDNNLHVVDVREAAECDHQ